LKFGVQQRYPDVDFDHINLFSCVWLQGYVSLHQIFAFCNVLIRFVM
jgi:hypothetical protein